MRGAPHAQCAVRVHRAPLFGNAAALALVVVASVSCGEERRGRDDGISVRHTLTTSEPVSIPFTAKRSGPHQFILDFAAPIADPAVRELIVHAGSTTGEPHAPEFDFSWQVLSDARVIAEGASPQRSAGVIQTGTTGLGGGPLTSTGLNFGGFDLAAGAGYTLRVVPGPGFRAIIASKPEVLVEYHVPSQIGRDVHEP